MGFSLEIVPIFHSHPISSRDRTIHPNISRKIKIYSIFLANFEFNHNAYLILSKLFFTAMIREFIVKMAVTVRKVVHNPRLRRPVIFMISLIWLQLSVLIGTILPEVEEQYHMETSNADLPSPIFTCNHFSLFFDRC